MFILLVTLILNQVNASDFVPKDGKYSYKKFDVEINVKEGTPVSAKIYDEYIPLAKKENVFYGETQIENRKTSCTVTANNKHSFITAIEEKVTLSKQLDNVIYQFKDLGIDLVIENNLISTMYTGLNNNKNATELALNKDGTIKSYSIYSTSNPYTLETENSEIKYFWCNNCDYQIGPTKNSIIVSENSYVVFRPNIIEMFNIDGVKKTIKTHDGKNVHISVFFYDNSDLLNSSTQFGVEKDNVTYKNYLQFIIRKSF